MISRERKLIFIHVPKTGGNSIKTALKPYFDADFVPAASAGKSLRSSSSKGFLDNFWNLDPEFGSIKHWSFAQYRKALGDSVAAFRVIACCRHPVDWSLSAYFFLKQSRQHKYFPWIDPPEETGPEVFSREEFLRFLGSGQPSQFSYLDGVSPECLSLIRFESLEDSFHGVCHKLGLPKIALPVLNQSDKSGGFDFVDNDLRSEIRNVYEIDFVSFGYS